MEDGSGAVWGQRHNDGPIWGHLGSVPLGSVRFGSARLAPARPGSARLSSSRVGLAFSRAWKLLFASVTEAPPPCFGHPHLKRDTSSTPPFKMGVPQQAIYSTQSPPNLMPRRHTQDAIKKEDWLWDALRWLRPRDGFLVSYLQESSGGRAKDREARR